RPARGARRDRPARAAPRLHALPREGLSARPPQVPGGRDARAGARGGRARDGDGTAAVRALVLGDDGLRLDPTYPDPKPRKNEAIVRVLKAGICGTDLEML